MVSADSRRVSRAPRYSGTGFESGWFSSTRLSRSMAPLSNGVRLTTRLVTLLLPALQPPLRPKRNQPGSRDPSRHRRTGSNIRISVPCRVGCLWDAEGLGCSDFARHYSRNRGFFLLLGVLRWFTSPRSLDPAYVFSGSYMSFAHVGFPIRKSPDQRLCAAPRSLSQLATSFIA